MMPYIYFDTSAWLKLYISEAGSAQAAELASAFQIVSSSIVLAESLSALKRRYTNRELSKAQFTRLVKQITADIATINTMPLNSQNLSKSEKIVLETPSGALDALHIAAALLFQDMTKSALKFVTADKRQAQSAEQVGLKVLLIG
ncbi:MAG: type II toxin-antitoxin system VapC family toxin [Desulfuromonadaceae bacterium]